jgi:acyl-CoA dehydrogenase
MDFDYSEKVDELRAQLDDFMRYHIEPANREWHQEVCAGRYPIALIERLKSRAFSEDLWNLFLPGLADTELASGFQCRIRPACRDHGTDSLGLGSI